MNVIIIKFLKPDISGKLLLLNDNLGHLSHSLCLLPARYPSWFPWLVPVLSHSLYLRRLISNLCENPARGALPQMIFASPFISLSLVPVLSPHPQGTMTLAHGYWILLPPSMSSQAPLACPYGVLAVLTRFTARWLLSVPYSLQKQKQKQNFSSALAVWPLLANTQTWFT